MSSLLRSVSSFRPISSLFAPLVFGSALALATLGTAGCTSGDALLLDVSTDDGLLDRYDLIIRDPVTHNVVVRTGWSDGKVMMKKPGVLGIGITVKQKGDYQIVLVGLRGNRSCLIDGSLTGGPVDAGVGDNGAAQYFWATKMHLEGDIELTVKMLPVPFANDADCDIFPDATAWASAASFPKTLLDCNDSDPSVNPFAVSSCGTGIDSACEGILPPACVDTDNDGDPDCGKGSDPNKCDCAPMDPTIHHPVNDPKSPHFDPYPESANCCGYSLGKMGADGKMSYGVPLCHAGTCDDKIDQDCNGKDSACQHDQDCDSYNAKTVMQAGCMAPPQVPSGDDCNDCNPAINPSAVEVCDGIDNNCNGLIDETCTVCDVDGDNYQRADKANGCPDAKDPHPGQADCNDDDRGVFPGSGSVPVPIFGACTVMNAAHNVPCALRQYCLGSKANTAVPNLDCSATIAGCPDPACDADGDGFVDIKKKGINGCPGNLGQAYDCDDTNHTIFYGAPEKCGDGIIQNCNLAADQPCSGGGLVDADGDHYTSDVDCNDGDKDMHPFNIEICDGKDNDCDGLVDEGNPDAMGKLMGTAALMSATSCTDSNVGDCGRPPAGRCVCSVTPVDNHHFEPKNRVMCPTEPADAKLLGAHCFFAPQPTAEVCDGRDNDCNGDTDAMVSDDIFPLDHMKPGMVTDCPGPLPLAKICCGPAGQNKPSMASCKDPKMDPDHCNGCNLVCSNDHMATRTCGQVNGAGPGVCNGMCAVGYADCDKNKFTNGCEIDLYGDIANCGSCAGACSANNIATHCSMPGTCDGNCNAGFLDCNNDKRTDGCEINGQGDPSNCGGCAMSCSNNNIATPSCAAGKCNGACNNNFADCNGNKLTDGCEINLQTDPLHCGGCALPCSNKNINVPLCGAGLCNAQCNNGFLDCDSNKQTTGCETDGFNDIKNCGACGTVCSPNHIAAVTCANVAGMGTCNGKCVANFLDCDMNKQINGCEVDSTLVNNCGGCGNVCSTMNIAMTACTSVAGVYTCTGACNAGFLDCNMNKLTDGCEKNGYTDPTNCGGCGKVCSNMNIAMPACGNLAGKGTCNGGCDNGFADCNMDKLTDGCEKSIFTDVANCGGCGVTCSSNNIPMVTCAVNGMNQGTCNGACGTGFADCNMNKQTDGCEKNIFADTANCGACGTMCSPNHMQSVTCGNVAGVGTCNGMCTLGFADCNANKQTDGCETSTFTDIANCGGCSIMCSANNIAAPVCSNVANAGTCTGTCNTGFADCNNNKQMDGCEASTYTDAGNCGGCGKICSGNNIAAPTCTMPGTCNGTCNNGFADCNGNKLTDGCEKSIFTDPNNCGACGTVCSNSGMASITCGVNGMNMGVCNGSCAAGFADCDNNKQTNGCEKNIYTDINNCGACGVTCSSLHIAPACSNVSGMGACTGACNAGFADCNNNKQLDGCETDITQTSNCGGCGKVCSGNHISVTACSNQTCSGACDAGFADCNNDKLTDGCETPITADVANCGGCSVVCSTQNITRACAGGSCNAGTCTAGFADCNANKQTDGCETATSANVQNCGGCGLVCSTQNITRACAGGSCNAGTCTAGFADCNANKQTDGCETPTNADVLNCGGCGTVCSTQNITRACAAGSCSAGTCTAGFADCNTNKQLDGCEVATSADVVNCGGCGTVCSTQNITRACAAGSCSAGTCTAGFADCDANKQANGCECDLSNHQCAGAACKLQLGQTCAIDGDCASNACCGLVCVDKTTDNANCGSCGTACGAATQCAAGSCNCNQAACGALNGCCTLHTCVTVFTNASCDVGGPGGNCANCVGTPGGGVCIQNGNLTHCGCNGVNDCLAGYACTTATKVCGSSCNPGGTTSNCNGGCCQGSSCVFSCPGMQTCGGGGAGICG